MLENLFRLDNKVAVIIGGRGGIGKGIAEGFVQYGAKVVIASRNLEELEKVAEEIRKNYNADISAMQVDVTDEESVKRLRDQIVAKYGTVDILVNAHGYNAKAPAVDFPLQEWDKLFDINVKGTMLTCKEFGKIMIEKRKGKIINFSSVRGIRVTKWPGNLGYCTTKSAVDMITKALAAEWAPYNVNVNAIAPAWVDTGFSPSLSDPAKLKVALESIPMNRIATLKDVVGVCIFLASPASDFITGQIIYVDGGLTLIG
ncbi:MAG: glucose 1-dehydrogenase [Candidatus Bathyarchaeia archaeon]